MVQPITQHTFLDRCWVCDQAFGPSRLEERHHIIPRAYGGVDGPQVSLCDSHHITLHKIALRMYSKKSYYTLLTRNQEQDAKLLYLASVVHNARILTENDPNKKQVLVLSLKRTTQEKLRQLKSVYGNVGRERLVMLAIDALHQRHFK